MYQACACNFSCSLILAPILQRARFPPQILRFFIIAVIGERIVIVIIIIIVVIIFLPIKKEIFPIQNNDHNNISRDEQNQLDLHAELNIRATQIQAVIWVQHHSIAVDDDVLLFLNHAEITIMIMVMITANYNDDDNNNNINTINDGEEL